MHLWLWNKYAFLEIKNKQIKYVYVCPVQIAQCNSTCTKKIKWPIIITDGLVMVSF